MTTQDQVQVGQRWLVRLHGTFTTVRITQIRTTRGTPAFGSYRARPATWRADAIDETSGRAVVIKSATKLRKLVPDGVTPSMVHE